jgi:hypothetical protein
MDLHWFCSQIRIRIEIKSCIGSALKPKRSHNTGANGSLFGLNVEIKEGERGKRLQNFLIIFLCPLGGTEVPGMQLDPTVSADAELPPPAGERSDRGVLCC